MSVYLRGTHWHYRFMLSGKDYSGPCPGCTNLSQAKKFESDQRAAMKAEIESLKQTEADIRKNKTVAALVENYRMELSGGSLIAIKDAYALASAKPSKRAAESSYAELRQTYWDDFSSYMESEFPDIKYLSGVRRTHCESYISYISECGRFNGRKLIASKTIHEIASVCKWVFSRLEEDAGISHNPWNNVVLPTIVQIPRDIFTMDELVLIWNGIQSEDFLRPLFVIAANSGLTEGDICTLKWEQVDFAAEMIRRKRNKTGVDILCPLLPELASYLSTFPHKSEYILPEHAERYLDKKRRTSVSRSIHAFLNGLGIKTQIIMPGRKAVSVKDLHSLRHVFCYRAKKYGIPESTIQKYVGHKVLEMTKHYADHDTEDDLRAQIRKLPALFVETEQGANQGEVEGITLRRRLVELLPSVPVETVRRWLGELSQALPMPQ